MREVLASTQKKVREKVGLTDHEWAVFERHDPHEWEHFQRKLNRQFFTDQAAQNQSLYRSAAQIVIGYWSGYGRPSSISMVVEWPCPAQIQMRWVGEDPGRTKAIIQSMLAGPLAEARVRASQEFGDTVDFDLSSSAENLLAVRENQNLVDVDFLYRGEPVVVRVDATPFRTELELLQGLFRQSRTAARQILKQLLCVRQLLIDPRIWAAITHIVKEVQGTAPSKVRQLGIAGDGLAQLLAELNPKEIQGQQQQPDPGRNVQGCDGAAESKMTDPMKDNAGGNT